MMDLAMIVAIAEGGVIGKDNQMPWHIPEDLKYFKRVTMGHPIIMGRKTYESIGKALPGRLNIVLSTREDFAPSDAEVARTIDDAIKLAESSGAETAFIIGGAGVYESCFDKVNRVYLTEIYKQFDGDTHFPRHRIVEHFEDVSTAKDKQVSQTGLEYQFKIYERKSALH